MYLDDFENTHKKHWYTKDTLDRLIEMGPWYFVEKNKRREYIELLFGIESGFKGRVERMEKDRMEKVYELTVAFDTVGRN